jgi:hypothetical protein
MVVAAPIGAAESMIVSRAIAMPAGTYRVMAAAAYSRQRSEWTILGALPDRSGGHEDSSFGRG